MPPLERGCHGGWASFFFAKRDGQHRNGKKALVHQGQLVVPGNFKSSLLTRAQTDAILSIIFIIFRVF